VVTRLIEQLRAYPCRNNVINHPCQGMVAPGAEGMCCLELIPVALPPVGVIARMLGVAVFSTLLSAVLGAVGGTEGYLGRAGSVGTVLEGCLHGVGAGTQMAAA
jgi:hypothetical protein